MPVFAVRGWSLRSQGHPCRCHMPLCPTSRKSLQHRGEHYQWVALFGTTSFCYFLTYIQHLFWHNLNFLHYLLYLLQLWNDESSFQHFYFWFLFKLFPPKLPNQAEWSHLPLVLLSSSWSAVFPWNFPLPRPVLEPLSLFWLTCFWPANVLSYPCIKFQCQTSTPNVFF